MIEPQQLIKLAKKLNYDLGLRINQQKEVLLDVARLPSAAHSVRSWPVSAQALVLLALVLLCLD
jgi:hypothetical protein